MEEGMEKRLLLSFALSILVLFGFGWFYSTPAEETAPPAVEVEPGQPAAVAALAPVEEPAPEALEAAPAIAEGQDVQAEAVSATSLISGPFGLSFSNEGAVLTSVRLRDYIDGAGQPLELIGGEVADTTGWPLGIRTGDPETDAEIETALFAVEATSTQIRMEYAAAGLNVVKTFQVAPDSYRLEVEAEVRRDGDAVPFSLLWQGSFGEDYSSGVPLAGASGSSIVYRDGLSFERLDVGGIEDPNEVPATMYAGVADRYFVAMFLLSDARPPRVSQVPVDMGDGEFLATPRLEVPYTGGPVGLYVGPQQEQRLTEVDPALADVIDYGFFGILSRPMMFGLVLIHDSIIDNWGWSIIVLTIFINFIFFPLRLKQQLSMQKMQKIQPQMRTLQDKYKKLKANDPRRPEVQAEMMGLYKKNGVNPLGGCLPLLLQMPFFDRDVRALAGRDRVAASPMGFLDPGSGRGGPLLRVAGNVRPFDVRAAEDNADGHGPDAGPHHDDHAGHAHRDVSRKPERTNALLAHKHAFWRWPTAPYSKVLGPPRETKARTTVGQAGRKARDRNRSREPA